MPPNKTKEGMFMIAYIRKCTILLVALILFFSMGNVAFATSEDSKAPELVMGTQGVQWVNTNSVDVDLL